MLELAAAEINLKYLDELGFCRWCSPGYTYYPVGEQKRQDNGSTHKSFEVREYWTKGESLGVYIFFLPKYCSEMNRIELEWQQLKKHEISGEMFDDEIDLAYAVIDGIDPRGERNNYHTKRFKFNNYSSS